ncbi:MAG TPA: DUF401 family protein [Schnuerera sp.]|nr:DUF401 family protein [Schnuerera sp.]
MILTQLISVLISFLFIPILIRLKFKLSYTLLISAGILGLLSGLGFENLSKIVTSIIINPSSRTTVLTVMMVSILGGLMKHYKILDKVVETILLVIRNKKNALMIIPAMIGILVIPGGAYLSAPFINNIGKEMKISAPRRAAINLVFRHIAMFLLPYSTSLLIVSATLPDLNIFKLILLNLFFVVFIIFTGYFFFLKDVKSNILPPRENIGKNLLKLAIYTSPIYIAVIINAFTGLPFHITLIASVIIVYLLSDKKDFFKILIKSLNWSTVLTVVAVLIMKEIILNMEELIGLFNNMLNLSNGMFSMLGIFLISSFFFGYITGNITASLAIILPMLSQLNIMGQLLYIYTYFAFGSAFIGYYFSPLHLCQAFTLEHMGVTTGELYKEYRFYAPTLLVILIISTLIFKFIFV